MFIRWLVVEMVLEFFFRLLWLQQTQRVKGNAAHMITEHFYGSMFIALSEREKKKTISYRYWKKGKHFEARLVPLSLWLSVINNDFFSKLFLLFIISRTDFWEISLSYCCFCWTFPIGVWTRFGSHKQSIGTFSCLWRRKKKL